MDENFVSFLRFIDYNVEEMIFKRNFEYESLEDEIKISLSFSAGVSISEKKDKADVRLTCTIFDEEFDKNISPFYLKTTMRGMFECSNDIDIEEFELNGVAILLPYMRAVITNLTAQAGISPVKIPLINVYNLLDGKETSVSTKKDEK